MITIKRHFIFSCLGDLLDIKKTKEYKDVQPSRFCLERRTIGKLARHYTTRGSLKVLTPPESQEKANGLQDQKSCSTGRAKHDTLAVSLLEIHRNDDWRENPKYFPVMLAEGW